MVEGLGQLLLAERQLAGTPDLGVLFLISLGFDENNDGCLPASMSS